MVTGSVTLRDVVESDLQIFYEHQREPEANQMAAFPARERDAFMIHWLMILADDELGKMTILLDGEVAGNVVSFEQDGRPLVGYWIGKDYWGKGVATEALAQYIRILTTRPLYAYVAKRNVGSLRVLQKCGFTIIGENREAYEETGEVVEEYLLELAT